MIIMCNHTGIIIYILLIEHLLSRNVTIFYCYISINKLKMQENTPCLFDLIQIITVKIVTLFFLERQKYTGKPKFGKLLIKKAWRAWRTKKDLFFFQTESVERIIFSTYVRYNMYNLRTLQYVHGILC